MKRFPILLLFFILLSCKKADTVLISENDLAGGWLLKEYSGGIVYRVIAPTDSMAVTFEKPGEIYLDDK